MILSAYMASKIANKIEFTFREPRSSYESIESVTKSKTKCDLRDKHYLASFTIQAWIFFCRNLAYQYRRMMSVPNNRRGSTPVHAVFTRRQVSYTSTASTDVLTNELFASSKDYAGRALPASLHDIFKVRKDSWLILDWFFVRQGRTRGGIERKLRLEIQVSRSSQHNCGSELELWRENLENELAVGDDYARPKLEVSTDPDFIRWISSRYFFVYITSQLTLECMTVQNGQIHFKNLARRVRIRGLEIVVFRKVLQTY